MKACFSEIIASDLRRCFHLSVALSRRKNNQTDFSSRLGAD